MPVLAKSQQVENYLRSQITDRRWGSGCKLPTEKELGCYLGVSSSTVKHVMVRLAEEGVLERRQRLGTFVAKKADTATVAILAQDEMLTSPMGYYLQTAVCAARNCISDAGFRSSLEFAHGRTHDEVAASVRLLEKPISRNTLGVLSLSNVKALENRFREAGIFLVTLGTVVPSSEYCVVLDYESMMRKVPEIFAKHGYDEFVIMWPEGPEGLRDTELTRKDEALRLMAVGGCRDRLIKVPWSLEREHAHETLKKLWARPNRPRAIFFEEDSICDVALRAVSELGIQVPDELAILTHANVGRPFHYSVPLDRLEFDPVKVISTGWEMLHKLIEAQCPEPKCRYIEPKYRQGQSLSKQQE